MAKEHFYYLLEQRGDLPIGSGTMETSSMANTTVKAFSPGQMERSTKASGNRVDHTVTEATKVRLVESTLETGVTEHSTELELVSTQTESCTPGNSRTTFDMELEPVNGQMAVATPVCGITMRCETRRT